MGGRVGRAGPVVRLGSLLSVLVGLCAGCAAGPPHWERGELPFSSNRDGAPRVIALCAFERLPERGIALTRAGAIARTGDGGRTWHQGNGLVAMGGRLAQVRRWVAVAARADERLWALGADGTIARSRDGCAAWWYGGKAPRAAEGAVMALGPPGGELLVLGYPDGSVWLSEESGRSWRRVDRSPVRGAVRALAIAPTRGGVRIYVCTEAGLFRTSDGGASWRRFEHPAFADGVRGIRIHPHAPHMVAVLTPGGAGFTGLVLSRNAGGSWRQIEANMGEIVDLAYDPASAFRFYALAGRRVWRSDDFGEHFVPVSTQTIDASRLALLAVDPPRVVAWREDGTIYQSP